MHTLIGVTAATLILGWAIAGLVALGYIEAAKEWLDKPGNYVRASVWTVVLIVAAVTWLVPALRGLAPELTGLAFAVVVVDELGRYRAWLQYKHQTIKQMGSLSNDFALEAARLAMNEGWLHDGSLKGANLEGAHLKRADLRRAHLEGANLYGAYLTGAWYNNETTWSDNFDPQTGGALYYEMF